ncbi:hypothetical protein [Rheinheimera sp.]|uniref:hypothetical protein n=1 Tax=Rheinheimera sp. TaxID=1869214 RepID=UPI00307CCEFA
MLEKKKKFRGWWARSEVLKATGKENPTADDVLDVLMGRDQYSDTDYLVHRYDEPAARTMLQRFNFIWFMPLYLLTVPFQWLIRGQVGVNRNSRMGRIFDAIVGFN